MQHTTSGNAAIVAINSKGNDLIFADQSCQAWAKRLALKPLRDRDLAMYTALGYPAPPTLQNFTAFVPLAQRPDWESSRPPGFPRTIGYKLSYSSAIRHACSPNDEDERGSTIFTRQCIEEAAGAFAEEYGIETLSQLVDTLETEFLTLTGERARWRNQFQSTTLGAALRQLRATERDLGPILGRAGEKIMTFPVELLANGGAWVVDVAQLPQRAAHPVLDELMRSFWNAKANGIIPHELPLVLKAAEQATIGN